MLGYANLAYGYGKPVVPPWTYAVNTVLPDQFDPMNCKLMVPSFQSILDYPSSNKTFEELCFLRAEEIRSWNIPVFVQYSGGTDSSTALISMLRSWPKEDLNRLHVLMSIDSVLEFPEFWPEVRDTFKGRIFDVREEGKWFHDRGVVITGEAGDQVFGSIVMNDLVTFHGNEAIHEEWHKKLPNILVKNFRSKEEFFVWFEYIQQTIEKCPFKLNSAFDVAWWLNYTNKLQSVAFRGLTKDTTIAKTYLEKNISFYLTKDFLRWSLDNHDKKIMETYLSYKWPAKKFIHKYTAIEEHWKRPKIGSLDFIWQRIEAKDLTHFEYATPIKPLKYKPTQLAIDENFDYVSEKDIHKYIRHV